jgi:hypothetical protein
MPSMSCVIEVDESSLSAHGWVTAHGERSAWVDLNAYDRSLDGPFLGRSGELSLYGGPAAMRRLAEAILHAVHEAEHLPVPVADRDTAEQACATAS